MQIKDPYILLLHTALYSSYTQSIAVSCAEHYHYNRGMQDTGTHVTVTSEPQDSSEPPLTQESLFEQVKESTERNRNFFFIWIAFAIYVIVTTTATTDLQLLLPNSTVTLPTVGVQLPLLGYFLVTPWLVLILHFNLLQNLDTHAHKLEQWARSYPDQQPPRVLLQAFIFDFAMLERDALFYTITRWSARLLCYTLGPITIGILLWRFTDYQDVFFTLIHMVAFVASTVLVIWAHYRLPQFQAEVVPKGWPIWPGRRIVPPRFLRTLHRRLGITGLVLAAIVLLETAWVVDLNLSKNGWLLSKFYKKLEPFVPRLTVPPSTSLVNLDGNLKLRMELDGETVFKTWWGKHGVGADLKGRSLQGAVLRHVDMRKAQLERAQLQGADLRDAQLQGANLGDAQLQGADLRDAQLQGALLLFAQLQGAHLWGAQLQGANLFHAQLQEASLNGARLQGANLEVAQLQGADLRDAQLQGADLRDVQLQGANLGGAQLQGAIVVKSSVNTTPAYQGTPLVLEWVARADDSDWTDMLKQAPARHKFDLQRARDKAQQPPPPGLQKELDDKQTQPNDYPQVAKGVAATLCKEGVEALRGAFRSWAQLRDSYRSNIILPALLPQRGAILADALLQENSCLSQRKVVCQVVKEAILPISNQQACNAP